MAEITLDQLKETKIIGSIKRHRNSTDSTKREAKLVLSKLKRVIRGYVKEKEKNGGKRLSIKL
jgi:hypothetical protein